jgi:tartrate dehydratase alpha subunit/fumarate hydratase class I-like protein
MALLNRRRFLTLGGCAGLAGATGAYSVLVERCAIETNTYRIPVRFNCYPEIAVLELVPG